MLMEEACQGILKSQLSHRSQSLAALFASSHATTALPKPQNCIRGLRSEGGSEGGASGGEVAANSSTLMEEACQSETKCKCRTYHM